MATELFSQICAIEEKADAIVQKAHADARDILKQAEMTCLEEERSAAKEFRALFQSKLDESRDAVSKELEKKSEAAKASLEKEIAAARAKIPDAVKLITERVLSDGNS